MNTKWTAALLALLPALAPAGAAQEPDAGPPQASEEARARLDDLSAEIDEFVDAWRAEQLEIQRKAREEAEKAAAEGRPMTNMPAMRMRPDLDPFAMRLIGWAEEADGEDAALYLATAVQLGDMGEDGSGRAALDLLVRDHATSPSWSELGPRLATFSRSLGAERADEIVALLAKSPHGDVRAWAAMALYGATIESAERDSDAYRAARAALVKAIAEASDGSVKDELQGAIDLREKLSVGAEAPDIVGVDLDGVAFKLSDYAGKVVFLDFWGDW